MCSINKKITKHEVIGNTNVDYLCKITNSDLLIRYNNVIMK